MTTASIDLVVDGYVRNIQSLCNQMIPDVITILIFKYYLDVAKKLWFIRVISSTPKTHPIGIYISPDIDIEDVQKVYINQQTTNYKCKMFDISDENVELSISDSINFLDGGLCCKSNVIFPKNKIISQLQQRIRRDIDVMFQCKKSCYAKIMCEHPDKKEIIGYNWTLPSLPKFYKGCTVIYSDKHGLMVIGGHEKSMKFMNIHTLSFQTEDINDNENEWNWKNVTKTEVARQHSCCVIIGDNEDKLLVMGGYQYGGMRTYSNFTVGRPAMKRSECYDFNNNEWISLKNARYPRQKCGMFHDKQKNKIYLVGGQDGYGYCLNKFECYDIAKNIWCRLPSTNKKHGCHPVVWYEQNKNILCVVSFTANVIECIDLRQDTYKWNIVHHNDSILTLKNLFQTPIGIKIANINCGRLLKFD